MTRVEGDCGLIVLLAGEIFRRCRSRVTDLKSEFLQMFQRLMMMMVMVVMLVVTIRMT